MLYILCPGKSFKCISCFTEQCVKINVILKAVDYDKNVICRVCDHRPCGIRHGRPEDSIIICQYEHVFHIQKILANTGIALTVFSFAQSDRSMNLTKII